jgi:glucose-fructose oxidoreductase
MVDEKPGLEVDEHSITVARYAKGLSKFETRWGTFTDPWTMQPQPKVRFRHCRQQGHDQFYDYADTIRVQTEAHPEGKTCRSILCKRRCATPSNICWMSSKMARRCMARSIRRICRIGQQIVDAAAQSAREKRAVPLPQ